MNHFKIGPEIWEFETVQSFMDQFDLRDGDYIFTEKLFYDSYLTNIDANFIFYDDYGFGEPKNNVVDDILNDIKHIDIKRLIGIGGGSILDIAKILSMKDPISVKHVFDDLVKHEREMELVLIPTTCGTGCEVTAVSVIDIVEENTKIGKRIESNFADHAVLIEELLDVIPEKVFLHSSIDSLIHALEIYVAPTSNPYNDMFCKEAITTTLSGFKKLSTEGLSARFGIIDEFLRSSTLAGVALSNTTCGAVHALAMHFGSKYNVAHGEATSLFLIEVFKKYYEKEPDGKIIDLADMISHIYRQEISLGDSIKILEELINSLIELKPLSEYGVREEDLEVNVEKVIESQQRLLINNYVELNKNDLLDIYRKTYESR